MCGISPNTWTKINRNEEVSMTILNKICAGLGVSYGDIIEYVPKEEENEARE
jgi:DNA-binding Xre family transcriptional regulator